MDSASPSEEHKKNAQKAIKLAVSLNSILAFDSLLSLKAIKALGAIPSIDLLKTFKNQSLDEFKAHLKSHPKLLKDLGVSEGDALRKSRILCLAKLASKNVGGFIDYKTVASSLDVSLDLVEFWVIDGLH